MTTKRSFFDRLSGNSSTGDAFDSFDDELPATTPTRKDKDARGNAPRPAPLEDDLLGNEGQLPVDVHQTASD
ncbi:MAG: hypothetical protein NTY93_03090, partial [Candidatus Kaiserbacteria bacterium]|nr:hypothetical protein [Candidatus Kaiserbacteria bacterium]